MNKGLSHTPCMGFALTTGGGLVSAETSFKIFVAFQSVLKSSKISRMRKGQDVASYLCHIGGIYSIYVWHLNNQFRSHKNAVLLVCAWQGRHSLFNSTLSCEDFTVVSSDLCSTQQLS